MLSHLRLLASASAALVVGATLLPAADAAKAKGKNRLKNRAAVAPAAKAEPLTLPSKPLPTPLDAAGLARLIDGEVNAKLSGAGLTASPPASDAEFLRRVSLDITGIIPTADRAAAFLDSRDAQKRAKLVDELLAGDGYGRHMADVWDNMLFPRTSDNRKVDSKPLTAWLEKEFNRNAPWSDLARGLLTAEGTDGENGAVIYTYGNGSLDRLTDSATKLFLGVQLQCAQCHNHPFTSWKQTEYWGVAAFFEKVAYKGGKPGNKNGENPAVGEDRGRPLMRPEAAKSVSPKFLGGAEPKLGDGPRRPAFAAWLTASGNPFFAKAMVNRVWAQFFGKGLTPVVDDVRDDNPASHPELFAALADQFAAGKFDLKRLIRGICLSNAYGRASRPLPGNRSDDKLLSHATMKVLSPEQLYDSVERVVGSLGNGQRGKAANAPKGKGNGRDAFVQFFQTEEAPDATKYEAGIPQALKLMNAPATNRFALPKDFGKGRSFDAVAEDLFLKTLGRRPTPAELATVRRQGEDGAVLGDLLWALLNCSEFALNH